jgi:hypothetical protein
MQYGRIGGVVRTAIVAGIVALLAACNGSNETSSQALRNDNPLTISGSIGDGPVVDAAVTVTDAGGAPVVAGVSNNSAGYQITVPAGTTFPITVVANGGTDLVTGLSPDFDFKAVLTDPTIDHVNVSPFSTFALAVAKCGGKVNGKSIANAWSILSGQLSMGMDPARVPNPTNGLIDATNVADIVLANEALGETLRRTEAALAGTSAATDAATLVDRLGCDLVDGVVDGVGGSADPRSAATFAAASAGVMVELIAGQLRVNGADAMGAMDQAIQTILPGIDPSVTTLSVPVSDALVKQAGAALTLVMSTLPDDLLLDYSILLASTTGADARAALNGVLTSADVVTFDGFAARVASSDETQVVAVSEAALQQTTATPPIISLAASPNLVSAGGSSLLSWSTVDAQRCKASGDWNGRKAAQGTYATGALQTSKNYGLQCIGLGGSTAAQTTVQVGSAAPAPVPAPVTTLTANPASIASGASSMLTWSATNADSCVASGAWSGTKAASGSQTVGPLLANATYSLACTGSGGTNSATATVLVQQPSAAPTLAFAASPLSVASGGSSTLTWSSANATSCTASGDWTGTRALSGSATVGPLATAKTYTLACTGSGGTVSRSASVTIAAPSAPTLTFTASPTSVQAGASSTLTWSTTNATSCTASGAWTGTKSTSGTQSTGALASNSTYTLTCTGAGGSVSQTANVALLPAPTLSFTALPTSIASGASSQLTWAATNATSCTASGSWTGTKATSGTQTTGALSANASYTLSCTGPGGSASQTAAVTVTAAPPTLTLTASPTSIQSGNASSLTWSTTNATSCTASGAWTGAKGTSGTQSTGTLTANSSFTLTCAGGGGTVAQTASVTVTAGTPSVTLSANPPGVARNTNTTLSWTSANVTSCTASGSWSGTKAISGSESVGPITQDSTYSLNCSGAGGSAVAMTTVSLREATLSWQAPTKNVDGSALTNLAGYKIYYGTSSKNYTQTVSVSGASTTTWTIPLAAGTYYFAMTAVDSSGAESAKTNEVTKTVN